MPEYIERENEYIEREAAKRTIVEAVDNGLATTSADLAEILDELPTADVAPMRHGRWQTLTGDPTPRCTACHKEAVKLWHGGWYTPDHCPNCGAKMDGGAP